MFIFQKHPWQENYPSHDCARKVFIWGSYTLDFNLAQLVQRFNKSSQVFEGLVFVLGHSKGDIWWLKLLGGPPSKWTICCGSVGKRRMARLRHGAAGEPMCLGGLWQYGTAARQPLTCGPTHCSPQLSLITTCHWHSGRERRTSEALCATRGFGKVLREQIRSAWD